MSTYLGVDVSHWQGNVDWAAYRRGGVRFAILKAFEGTSYSYSDWFSLNWQRAKAAGIYVGAYHWIRHSAWGSGTAQANGFVARTSAFRAAGGRLYAIDVERSGYLPHHQDAEYAVIRDFVAQFRRLVPNATLLIYTSSYMWGRSQRAGSPGSGEALGVQLWDANWPGGPSSPRVPSDSDRRWNHAFSGWSHPTLLQHFVGVINISGARAQRIDHDSYRGTEAGLRALFGGTGGVPPDPEPCPSGQHRNAAGICVPNTPPTCPAGQHRNSQGVCVPDIPTPPGVQCPPGYHREGTLCIADPAGPWDEPWYDPATGTVNPVKVGAAVGGTGLVIAGVLVAIIAAVVYGAKKMGGKTASVLPHLNFGDDD